MIAMKKGVTAGIAQACADGLVGIGRGASLATLQARYCRHSVSLDPSEDGVWIFPAFTPEPAKVPWGEEPTGAVVGTGEPGSAGLDTASGEASGTPAVEKPGAKGTVRRFVVRGKVPVQNWGELFRCFVGPAAQMSLKRLGLGVRFEMVLSDDRMLSESYPVLNAMKEASRQLGLDFEVVASGDPEKRDPTFP